MVISCAPVPRGRLQTRQVLEFGRVGTAGERLPLLHPGFINAIYGLTDVPNLGPEQKSKQFASFLGRILSLERAGITEGHIDRPSCLLPALLHQRGVDGWRHSVDPDLSVAVSLGDGSCEDGHTMLTSIIRCTVSKTCDGGLEYRFRPSAVEKRTLREWKPCSLEIYGRQCAEAKSPRNTCSSSG